MRNLLHPPPKSRFLALLGMTRGRVMLGMTEYKELRRDSETVAQADSRSFDSVNGPASGFIHCAQDDMVKRKMTELKAK
jgi:hypothetical protein